MRSNYPQSGQRRRCYPSDLMDIKDNTSISVTGGSAPNDRKRIGEGVGRTLTAEEMELDDLRPGRNLRGG